VPGAGECCATSGARIASAPFGRQADAEPAFRRLMERQWDTLHDLGFVTDDTSVVLRQVDESTFVKIFTWVEGGFEQAHEHPDVLAIWEPMEPLLEDRGGLPKCEFPHYRSADLGA
jgi:hypothetical protein